MKFCRLLLFCCCILGNVSAQVTDYHTYKEKIYLQTSHVFFKPGDEVFFKLYLVHAQNNTPSAVSNIVYVDVLSPSGNLVQHLVYRAENGYAEGSYAFSPEAPGGIYKLRAYTTWMKNERDSTLFEKTLTLQRVIAARILMQLDFPVKGYGPGDEVVADFSARTLANRPLGRQTVKFAASLGGVAAHEGAVQTDTAGKATIRLRLPVDLATADGLLNITLQHDSYTESISRSIPITLGRVHLQLMPEGGTLVTGLPSVIAFRAVNELDKPVDVKGVVRNSRGQTVAAFESFHNGMGRFDLIPQAGEKYTAVLTGSGATYPLPNAAPKGVTLQLLAGRDRLLLQLHSSQTADVTLTGHLKEKQYYIRNLRLKKGMQTISIDPAAFPSGIARFTVLQANGLPLAERLVFLHLQKMLRVTIETDKALYRPREKVLLKIKTLSEQGLPVPSNFSLAVVDDKLWTFADDRQDHIVSWLMMSSELRGKVEEPQFYFNNNKPKAAAALDLVMLTHGYRYFDYLPGVIRQQKLAFFPDVENIISGRVADAAGKPVAARVWLASLYTPDSDVIQVTTADDGLFYFNSARPGSTYYVVAQSLRTKEKIQLQLTASGIGSNPADTGKYMLVVAADKVSPAASPVETRQLNEVLVAGFAAKAISRTVYCGVTIATTVKTIETGALPNLLAGRIAGVTAVQVANPVAGGTLQVRGGNTAAGDNKPLWVVDGIPLQNMDGALQSEDIKSIYVLKGSKATAIYGSLGINGVIIVETAKSYDARIKWQQKPVLYYRSQMLRIPDQQFTPVRRFYAPEYTGNEPAERTDFRETIYWNPVVQTDGNGEASVSFYNSDATTTFRAIAEGIGFNGSPGRADTTYATQHLITLDAKIPPYLTVGDAALIPLHIKNNHKTPLNATIQVAFTESAQAGIFTKTISMAAGASLLVHVPVTATSPVDGHLRFALSSDLGNENITLPVTVVQKGFPVWETFSGTESATHRYTLHKVIPGSLQYELKLFSDPETQLLEGIESMLREPHGCFEQASSATYPNIFILKYLREAGKSNPAIEQKATGYLQRGYQRLTGYETSEGGFEWFGKTPPHEALTAYGLMEFTDMAEFIEVDKAMLQRTKNFLLDRRDGKGGFLISTKGYDRFAAVPNRIANVYIVYAFTHAGFGAAIIPEYEHALAAVFKEKDTYLLAMMALAAHNLRREADFRQLMAVLRQQHLQKAVKTTTSVVNSKSLSLNVETSALYLMALAREKQPDIAAMTALYNRILAAKSYFGYSSTQATVLTLNATIDFAKARGKAAAAAGIDFLLNDRKIMPGRTAPAETLGANNTFRAMYHPTGTAVPYNMEVSYHTFTPPDSREAQLHLQTRLAARQTKVGETVRLQVAVTNQRAELQAMSIAKIGIPAGLAVQPWQLKELTDKHAVAYYELFDNYLVLYWMGFAPNETKTLQIDLKAEIPGTYKGRASCANLYYVPEHRHWNDGLEAEIMP